LDFARSRAVALDQVGASAVVRTLVGSRAPILDYTVQIPPGASAAEPLTVLLALHGMGGNGPDFARALTTKAARRGWLLVAPTLN
jgi:hypothetical protein